MAREFPGGVDATSVVTVTDAAAISIFAGNFSAGCWFYLDAHDASVQFMLGKGLGTGFYDIAMAVLNDTTLYIAAGNQGVGSVTVSGCTIGGWHYLFLQRPSLATVNVYLNDMASAAGTRTGANLADTGGDLLIGQGYVPASNNGINGRVANVIFYDRGDLTEAERILCKAGCPVPTLGLTGYWPLSLAGAASPEPDISGNGNNGVIGGVPTYVAHPTGISACKSYGGAVPTIGSIHPIYPIFS